MRSLVLAACSGLILLAGACSEPTSVDPVPTPQLTYLNGPWDLPNVARGEYRFAYVIGDVASGLVAVANFPDDPRTRIACGGNNRNDFVPYQDVGLLREVINSISVDRSANLHVYNAADIPNNAAFCTAMWIAKGHGRFLNVDNDYYYSGTRANTWGFHMNGAVEMVDGSGTRQLNAFQRLQDVRGNFFVRSNRVQLH